VTALAVITAATNSQRSVIAVHFWHGVEALGFLLVTLGGIGIVEWRERRRTGRPKSEPVVRAVEVTTESTAPSRWQQQRPGLLRVAALCSAAAAGVHYVVMPDHFHEALIYGLFFAVTATSQVGYAVLLLARPSRPLLFVGAVANAGVLVLWLITRLVAIPLGPGAGTTESFGALDLLASGFEVLFVLSAVALLLPLRESTLPRLPRLSRVLLEPGTLAFVTSAAVLIGLTAYAAPPS